MQLSLSRIWKVRRVNAVIDGERADMAHRLEDRVERLKRLDESMLENGN